MGLLFSSLIITSKYISINLLNEKRPIVLYAPTFRDKDLKIGKCSYKIDELCKLENIKFIVTCHPQERELAEKLNIPENVINALDEEYLRGLSFILWTILKNDQI